MSVTELLVPEHVRADMEREHEADRHLGRALHVDALIKESYPDCELVWVGERATAPGLTPARWHVRRRARDQGFMDTYIAWTGPDGEYAEPNTGILRMLAQGDLWNRDVTMELRSARRVAVERERKQQEALSAERVDTLATHLKSRLLPGVSFSDARPWTNRVRPLPGE